MVARIAPLWKVADSAFWVSAGSDADTSRRSPTLVDAAALSRFMDLADGPSCPVRAEVALSGPATFGRIELGTCSLRREQRHAAALEPGRMLVLAIDRGVVEGIGAGSSFVALEGDVLLVDLDEALPAACREFEAHFVILPPWLCDAALVRSGGWHGAVLPHAGGAAQLIRAAIALALTGEAENLCGLCESLATLIAAGFAGIAASRRCENPMPPVNLRQFIEENLADPDLSAARLAREFGMARASLYRQFDHLGGVASYVRRLRLRRARELIERSAGQRLRLSAIASEVGFASPTVFARAFRQAYGMTPRECLRQARPRGTRDALHADAGG